MRLLKLTGKSMCIFSADETLKTVKFHQKQIKENLQDQAF